MKKQASKSLESKNNLRTFQPESGVTLTGLTNNLLRRGLKNLLSVNLSQAYA